MESLFRGEMYVKDNKPGSSRSNHQNHAQVFAPPTPKVSRQKRAKVLTAAERAAFLASRPDLIKPPKD